MAERQNLMIDRMTIEQLANVIRALGWEIVGTDTRSNDLVVTISKPKPSSQTPPTPAR
jgi:hypothetical protein